MYYIHTYTSMSIYIYIYIYLHDGAHLPAGVWKETGPVCGKAELWLSPYMYILIYVYMYMHIYIYVIALSLYIYIYIYTCTHVHIYIYMCSNSKLLTNYDDIPGICLVKLLRSSGELPRQAITQPSRSSVSCLVA